MKDGKAVATVLTIPVKFKMPEESTSEQLPVTQLKLATFKASPNPTDGMLDVRFKAEAKATQLKIVDLNGRTVFNQDLPHFDGLYSQQINLEKATKGALILHISQGEAIFTHQIVVQ